MSRRYQRKGVWNQVLDALRRRADGGRQVCWEVSEETTICFSLRAMSVSPATASRVRARPAAVCAASAWAARRIASDNWIAGGQIPAYGLHMGSL